MLFSCFLINKAVIYVYYLITRIDLNECDVRIVTLLFIVDIILSEGKINMFRDENQFSWFHEENLAYFSQAAHDAAEIDILSKEYNQQDKNEWQTTHFKYKQQRENQATISNVESANFHSDCVHYHHEDEDFLTFLQNMTDQIVDDGIESSLLFSEGEMEPIEIPSDIEVMLQQPIETQPIVQYGPMQQPFTLQPITQPLFTRPLSIQWPEVQQPLPPVPVFISPTAYVYEDDGTPVPTHIKIPKGRRSKKIDDRLIMQKKTYDLNHTFIYEDSIVSDSSNDNKKNCSYTIVPDTAEKKKIDEDWYHGDRKIMLLRKYYELHEKARQLITVEGKTITRAAFLRRNLLHPITHKPMTLEQKKQIEIENEIPMFEDKQVIWVPKSKKPVNDHVIPNPPQNTLYQNSYPGLTLYQNTNHGKRTRHQMNKKDNDENARKRPRNI